VPVVEADVGTREVDEDVVPSAWPHGAVVFVDEGRRVGRRWWRLLYAVIDEVSVIPSVHQREKKREAERMGSTYAFTAGTVAPSLFSACFFFMKSACA
jgi:hypothetical protein